MTAFRYLFSVLVAIIVTLAAFTLMHRLIDNDASARVDPEPVASIRFENIEIIDEIDKVPPRVKPEREPPPEEPPPLDVLVDAPDIPREPPPRIDHTVLRGTGVTGISIRDPRRSGRADGDIVPITRLAAQYPRDALMNGIEGQVTVRFTITAAGKVIDPVVVDANPPRVFDKAALRAILRWTFKPRIVNGVAVERIAEQTFDFTIPD